MERKTKTTTRHQEFLSHAEMARNLAEKALSDIDIVLKEGLTGLGAPQEASLTTDQEVISNPVIKAVTAAPGNTNNHVTFI